MLTVRIDRQDCLRCGACWTVCPEAFVEDPVEGTAMIVGGGQPCRSSVPEGLIDCVRRAAAACPIDIIHLQNIG